MGAPPDRLRRLVVLDREALVEQPSVEVRHAAYRAWLPARFASIVDGLPGHLDRARLDALAIDAGETDDGLVRAFVAGQIWGHGQSNRGPWRLGQACGADRLAESLTIARETLRAAGPLAAFDVLVNSRSSHTIPWCAMAFGTKALRFLDPPSGALILDSNVARWLEHVASEQYALTRVRRSYERYLTLMARWETALDHPAERLEILMFSDAAGSSSAWRPARVEALQLPTLPRRGTCRGC